MPLTVTDILKSDVLVLRLSGRLDVATSPQLEQRLHEALEQRACRVVIDLADIEYVSSAGLRVLLSGLDQLEKAGGRLALSGAAGYTREVFEVAGLETVFVMTATVDEAEAAVMPAR